MKIKSKFIFVSLFIVFNTINYAQWYPQQAGTNYALKSVNFTDNNTGYICGYNLVLKTTNSGTNWSNYNLQGNHNSIKFANADTGYVASDSGKIFKTTNTGIYWYQQSSTTIKNLTSINFLNSLTGIATGYGKTLIKTTNGGSNWFTIANIIWEVDFLSSKIIDENNYFVTGTDSYIIRTTNGGTSWIPYTHGEVNPLFTVEFIDNNTGFATGCCGMFMVTTNSGVNWSANFYLSLGFTFRSLIFSSTSTGFCAGDNGMIYRSTNGGVIWDSTVTGTDQILYDVFMINNTTGWAVGGYGTILKTTNSGGTGYPIGVEPVTSEIPKDFMLYQNYPNPFNPVTKIKFNVPSKGRLPNQSGSEKAILLLKVFDLSGKELALLFNGEITAGSYEIEFNGSELASGIYYYILQYGSYRVARKMVLIK